MPLLPDLQLASGTGGSDDKFLLSVFKAVFGSISTSPDLRAQTALKSTSPSGRETGISLALWTARSMEPSKRACSNSETNAPFPKCLERENGSWSPSVSLCKNLCLKTRKLIFQLFSDHFLPGAEPEHFPASDTKYMVHVFSSSFFIYMVWRTFSQQCLYFL